MAEWDTYHRDPVTRAIQRWEQRAKGDRGVGLGGFTIMWSVSYKGPPPPAPTPDYDYRSMEDFIKCDSQASSPEMQIL